MLLLLCCLCCLTPFLAAAAASGQTDLLFIPTKNVTDSHWISKRLPFDGDNDLKLTICCLIVSFFLSPLLGVQMNIKITGEAPEAHSH